MMRKIVWSLVFIMAVVIAAGAAYMYSNPVMQNTESFVPALPQTQPDNTVVAGPVTSISTNSISVKKQDGTVVSLGIASTTQVYMAGQTTIPKKVSDINTGAMVLVTPSNTDATVVQSIVLLPAPPVQ